MKTFRFSIILTLSLIFAAGTAVGQDMGSSGLGPAGTGLDQIGGPTSPITSTTIGPATVPVSIYQGGVPQSQGSGLLDGNLLITGNVGGGQYFHGSVPYGSPLDFRGRLETTSLDSFLRYSSTTGQVFYSPTASPSVGYRVPSATGLIAGPSEKIRTSGTTEEYFVPLSQYSATLQQAATGTTALTSSTGLPGNYQSLMSQVQGYGSIEENIARAGISRSVLRQVEEMRNEQITSQPVEQGDILSTELDKITVSEPFKLTEQRGETTTKETTAIEQLGPDEQTWEQDLAKMKLQADEQIKKSVEEQWQAKLNAAGIDATKQIQDKQVRKQARADALAAAVAEEKPVATTKKFPSLEAEYGDKFDDYVNSGQRYIKEGKFYQAADAFTMASIYRPLEPLGYAGKALALFAAGEYLSSSRMLSAAFELNSEYAKTKLNIENLFSDKEILNARMADLQKWTKAGESGELLFLTAFIDYQMNKIIQAKDAIDLAAQKMPEQKAIAALKQVIDQAREMK